MVKLIKASLVGISLLAGVSAFAKCYQISEQAHVWSRTPEDICVEFNDDESMAHITLEEGLTINRRVVGSFDLDVISNTNKRREFGLSNPSNSVFNQLSIVFKVSPSSGSVEMGTVSVGETKFYYRARR